MTLNDKDRVNTFRRILNNSSKKENQTLNKLRELDLSDGELLDILNSTVLPNAISVNNLKYNLLFSQIYANGKVERNKIFKTIENIRELFDIISKSEKDLLKYGYFYGFDIFNWRQQMSKFIQTSNNPSNGELKIPKTISSYTFQRIFPFVYSIINRGEKNDQFPRI